MSFAEILGTAGVSMILLGFSLNLFGLMQRRTYKYVLLNLVGGALACTASIFIEFFPFVILEGTWTAVAVVGLANLLRSRNVREQA